MDKPFLTITDTDNSGVIINTDKIKCLFFMDIKDEEKAQVIIDYGNNESLLNYEGKIAQIIHARLKMMSHHVRTYQ